MMVPARPMTNLIIRQARLTRAALAAFLNAMFGFGHPSELPQRRGRRGVRQITIDFHHLLVVAVPVPQHEGVSHVLDPSEGSSKLIPIHEEANHQIVHLFRLGKAKRPTHSPFDTGP